MKNILGREVPDNIKGYGVVKHYGGYLASKGTKTRRSIKMTNVLPGDEKLHDDLDAVLDKLPLKIPSYSARSTFTPCLSSANRPNIFNLPLFEYR